jgi:hypothetical protein
LRTLVRFARGAATAEELGLQLRQRYERRQRDERDDIDGAVTGQRPASRKTSQ